MANFNPGYARHNAAICLAPGLFRSLQKGTRDTSTLDVRFEYGDGRAIHFTGPALLGAEELRVLQGVVALAGCLGSELPAEPNTDTGKQLRDLLFANGDEVPDSTLGFTTTLSDLARAVGYADYSGHRVREAIGYSLDRLCQVTVAASKPGASTTLVKVLAHVVSANNPGEISVALHPMLGATVLGRRAGAAQHVIIDLNEVRAIRTGPTRLIHQRLCGWIDPGQTRKVVIDTLSLYLGPRLPATGSALRMRRQVVRKALAELGGLGWGIDEYAPSKFDVRRPAQAVLKRHRNFTGRSGRRLTGTRANIDGASA